MRKQDKWVQDPDWDSRPLKKEKGEEPKHQLSEEDVDKLNGIKKEDKDARRK